MIRQGNSAQKHYAISKPCAYHDSIGTSQRPKESMKRSLTFFARAWDYAGPVLVEDSLRPNDFVIRDALTSPSNA